MNKGMKGIMKGKLLKKLKSIKPIGQLKQDRILLVNAADGFVETLSKIPIFKSQTAHYFTPKEPDQENGEDSSVVFDQELDVIDVAELMKDLEEDEMEVDDDKENVGPPLMKQENDKLGVVKGCTEINSVKIQSTSFKQTTPLSEIEISSFRRPDLNSVSLFDPNLLAAFEQAVKEHAKISEAERQARIEKQNAERSKQETRSDEQENVQKARIKEVNLENYEEEPPLKTRRIEEDDDDNDPLSSFEEKCPPGGNDAVILYTTTLRGVRKTFEDCSRIRFLLESFRVKFYERDVSMHTQYKDELWEVLEGKILPPRLFIRGRYIGGAEEVLRLHEQGNFRPLFEQIPIDGSAGCCEGCSGFRFVLCFHCNGSHRLIEEDGISRNCEDCNENGLIICPFCC